MEDVVEASWHSKKAEEIVGEAFELFVEAAEVLMLADKEGFEYLREILSGPGRARPLWGDRGRRGRRQSNLAQ